MTIEDEVNIEKGRLVVVEIISKKLKFHHAREMKKVALDENREKIDFNKPYITSIINTFLQQSVIQIQMAMSFTFSTCTFRLQIVIKIKFGRIKLEPGNDEETTRTVKL